ncbi:isoaspartyl peptidase/L-asparaginase, partial [Candidatus Sumerlaeota bacterium]|nr:isoaspartyl peptidase/L-asparaginase [Candidatus Sumerlaeota bacterium]
VLLPAVEAGWRKLAEGGSALEAAVAATAALEDEPSLNAGTGSNIRMDGETVQMDAAVMDQTGDFGAVAVIERVKNPVLVAREVMRSPHLVLAGDGAIRFARALGMKDYDPRTTESIQRYKALQARMNNGGLGDEWKDFDWKRYWNFPKPLNEALKPRDTVGTVVFDGKGGFAAAISTGGTSTTLYGRVGDVPIMGAGIYAGPMGAVATTGWGEYIIRENLSRRVYEWIASGIPPKEAAEKGLALYPSHIGIGVIAVSKDGYWAASNTQMAWSANIDGKLIRADQSEIK